MQRMLGVILAAAFLTILAASVGCTRRPATVSGTAPAGTTPAGTTPAGAAALRPAEWAQPIELSGCPNLHKVTDALYRGAQPTAEGFKQLTNLGISTVVNLRSFHSDRDKISGLQFNYVQIPMKAWHPEDEDVVRFLKAVTDKKTGVIFVHCEHGADRTGTMIAVYRIGIQGWSREQAVREMTEGGYGFHGIWQDLVDYVNKLDVEKMKQQAGVTTPAGGD